MNKTLADITNGINPTKLEVLILNYLNKELSGNFGETYSHIEAQDIADHLKLPVNTIKGGVGSLVKKDLLETWETEPCNFETETSHVINFCDQENMVASEGI
jgi:DNA-binding MarR family transcriptional regulator|tara:strand:- start:111 stop:416 length:306 start_codon:yes stop_codon:yes gene_type:complete